MESAIERGVARLREYLGEAALYLRSVKTKSGEKAAFHFLLPNDYLGKARTLRIAFPENFPDVPLKFAVFPSPWLEWPHCEKATVCLYTSTEQPVTTNPEMAVDVAMRRVYELISQSLENSDPDFRQREFEREVRSYWSKQAPYASHRITLLQLPWSGTEMYVVSERSDLQKLNRSYLACDDYNLITAFERRKGKRSLAGRATAHAGFFLKLLSTPSARLPSSELFPWLLPHVRPEDIPLFQTWVNASQRYTSRWLFLQLPGDSVAVHAFYLRSYGVEKGRARSFGRRAARRGSVSRHEPKHLLENAFVDVLDRAVVHSRAGAPIQKLATKRVVMVGAGSLGAETAVLLARSGVGHLTLVDPDIFEDVNIGRHVLGSGALGEAKVEALRDRIVGDVPTANVTAIAQKVQEGARQLQDELSKADMVVITTANWNSEEYMWRAKAVGQRWSIVHAWSEPHSIVGHVLCAPTGAFDGRRLFDGPRFKHRFSNWPDHGVRALPACGESYIPGGPIALSRIAGMTAQVALNSLMSEPIDPFWCFSVGSVEEINTLGGTYDGPSLSAGARHFEASRAWPESA